MPETGSVAGLAERRNKFNPQQSTVWTRRQQAVCVRGAYKKYGEKRNPNVILDGLSMTVPKGAIYGLLGASGCGKTTLLSCIVGRRRLNAGEIWVLGGKPGSAGSGVPGPRIGYMPQEIAINKEFSIRESLIYFGWINGMKTSDVDERLNFLIDLLQLVSPDRRVTNLSGGQQRRVSLACALVHEPELLILDEPTVGVDPILRQNIWDHLVSITKDRITTVIITTHYIDETRQASLIGLMRGGRLLAEESPDDLMQKYHSASLEDVFLKLSIIQNRGKRRRSSIVHDVTASISVPEIPIPEIENPVFEGNSEISGEFGESIGPPSISKRVSISIEQSGRNALDLPPENKIEIPLKERLAIFKSHHMKALVWKNFLWMWRNAGIMCFILGLPLFEMFIFCTSIGKEPTQLKIAIVNYEVPNRNCSIDLNICEQTRLSCRYLHFVEQRKQDLRYFNDIELAKDQVKEGKAWAAISFAKNFSEALYLRFDQGRAVSDWKSIDFGDIDVYLDKSNYQISIMLQRDLLLSFQEFGRSIARACKINENNVEPPIKFQSPIYGPPVPNFTDFVAPGIILTISFFLAVTLTSGAMLIERNEGILERSLVSGVTGAELIFAHVITQSTVMIMQATIIIVMATVIYDITIVGNPTTVIILTLLNGFCGMCFGFVVSCVTDSERNATYVALGSFLPFVLLCGIVWPSEGMNATLRKISWFLPLTLPTESMRSILARGWDMTRETVILGFASTIVWITIFLTVSLWLIKFKKG